MGWGAPRGRDRPHRAVPALRCDRGILMKTKNRDYLKFWDDGKAQLYGSAAETVQKLTSQLPSGSRFCELYFHQDGIKRGGVA